MHNIEIGGQSKAPSNRVDEAERALSTPFLAPVRVRCLGWHLRRQQRCGYRFHRRGCGWFGHHGFLWHQKITLNSGLEMLIQITGR